MHTPNLRNKTVFLPTYEVQCVIYFPKSVLLLLKMRHLVTSAFSFCMVIRRRQRCSLFLIRDFKYQTVRSAIKSSAYRFSAVSELDSSFHFIECLRSAHHCAELNAIVPFNPFCSFADEETGTRTVTDSPTASCGRRA